MSTVRHSPACRFGGRLITAVVVAAACMFAAAEVGEAAPIQRVQGVISEVGEGFLLLKPDGQPGPLRFILRWKARFVPPKVPFPGDRVLILYKDKEEGAVIYELNYLPPQGEAPPSAPRREERIE